MRTRRVDPERLLELREELWWTQAQLSEKSGVSRPTIIDMEKGRNLHPRNATLFALAAALGVGPNDLLEPRPGEGVAPLKVRGSPLSDDFQGGAEAARLPAVG